MKKRIGMVLLLLLFIFTAVFLFGAAKRSFELTITDGETVLLQKNYNIKLSTRLRTFLFHKGSYANFYKSINNKDIAMQYLNATLKRDIILAAEAYERPATDATVSWDGKEFTYFPEAEGVSVGKQDIAKTLYEKMGRKIEICVKKTIISPQITEEQLRQITVQISSYATNYANSSFSRKQNILLATSSINGAVIYPGESFSFNETVGARTAERGYMEAKIISGGQFVKGVGGGVCQVSTTLYNAALRAGLKIVSVSNHSLPIWYVPLSYDAMVSSSTDLVFQNTNEYPVYIKGESDDNNVCFTFYGKNENEGKSIVYRTEIIKVIPTDAFEDIFDSSQLSTNEPYKIITAPKSGYVSEAYMDVYEGGTLISSVLLRRDSYLPQKGVRIMPDKEEEIPPSVA